MTEKTQNRRLSGWKAKKFGDTFEDMFRKICDANGLVLEKIPSGCRYVWKRGRMTTVPVPTPFDFIIAHSANVAVLDCKTVDKDRFTYSELKDHQVSSLCRFGCHIAAGYVIWFRPLNRVVYFPSTVLGALKPRESLTHEDGLLLGGVTDFDPFLILKAGAPSRPSP